MTDAAEKEDEPSIEEILDSIKQIISDEEGDDDADVSVDQEFTEDSDEDDVLVLTDTVQSESKPEVLADDTEDETEEEFIAEPEEDQDVIEEEEPQPLEAAEDEIPEEQEDEEPDIEIDMLDKQPVSDTVKTSTGSLEKVLTDKAQQAALQGFSDLVRQSTLERGGITLEDIVRSELNPMLREWLDKYLPDIIERLVKEELHEITKRILN